MALSYKNDEYQDERLNPGSDSARRLQEQENNSAAGYNQSGDGLNDQPASGGDVSGQPGGPSKNIDDAKDQEERGGWANNVSGNHQPAAGRFSALKKKGPLGLIIGVLLGGGTGLSMLFSPALLLVQIKNVFTNDLSDSTPALSIRSDAILYNKIKGVQKTLGICGATVTIRCKFSTMSNRQIKNFEKAGIKVEGDNRLGRTAVSKMTLPDGRVASNPAELKALAQDPSVRSRLDKAFNPRSSFFLNSKFSTLLKNKFGLTKASRLAGDTKEKIKESFKKAVGATTDTNRNGRFKGLTERANNLKSAANKTFGVSLLCLAYDTSRSITAGVKITKAAAFASFALVFLTEADKIIAGDATPEVVAQLGDQLTSSDSRPQVDGAPNPKYGKTATDSEGFRLAAYGDVAALPDYANQYLLGGGAAMLALSEMVSKINSAAGGAKNVKEGCKVAQNGGVLQCLAGPGAAALCAAMFIAGPTIIGPLIEKLIATLVKTISNISLDDNTIGIDAGNAIFIGAGTIMGASAQSYGMKPSNKSDIKNYLADTNAIKQQYIAMDQYNARGQPFNINNQYSFLGSLVNAFDIARMSGSSFSDNITRFMSVIPNTMLRLNTASAAYSMSAQSYNPARYSQCDDQAIQSIGIDADVFCNVRFTMSASELNADADAVVKYMEDNDYINPADGTPKDSQNGYVYKLFLGYCVNRQDPYGESSIPIAIGSSSDEDWYTGKNCVGNSEVLSNFRTFTTDLGVDATMEEDLSTAGSQTSSTSQPDITQTSGVPVSGDAKALALQVANNPNITFVSGETKNQLTIFGNGGQVYDSCGKPMTVSKYLLGALQTNSSKYKIKVNNIGFKQDRDTCEGGTLQHPKGTAVDINDIQIIGGASTGGSIRYPGSDLPIVNQYATDFLAALPNNRGGVGQKQGGVNPTFPPGSVALNGTHLFEDSLDHLHIDARNRQNLMDTQ